MKMEAMKEQGKRTDLTLSQVATKPDTAAQIGKAQGESRDQVFRYIRLTNLIPEILQKVDEGAIALSPTVELSYLSEEQQIVLLDAMSLNDCTPSHAQSIRTKKSATNVLLNARSELPNGNVPLLTLSEIKRVLTRRLISSSSRSSSLKATVRKTGLHISLTVLLRPVTDAVRRQRLQQAIKRRLRLSKRKLSNLRLTNRLKVVLDF